MIIPIDEKTRIQGDERCWMIQVAKKVKGETRWHTQGYYRKFGRALSEAAEHEIRMHPAHGVQEALEALKQIEQKYDALFDVVPRSSQV